MSFTYDIVLAIVVAVYLLSLKLYDLINPKLEREKKQEMCNEAVRGKSIKTKICR